MNSAGTDADPTERKQAEKDERAEQSHSPSRKSIISMKFRGSQVDMIILIIRCLGSRQD